MNATALQAPSFTGIPIFYAGNAYTIHWTAVNGATHYALERRFGNGQYVAVYDGQSLGADDYIPDGITLVAYRIKAYIANDDTWDELDALSRTWDEIDAAAQPWTLQESEWTIGEYAVTPNRPPVISGEDQDLGIKMRGFQVAFSITDPDPDNTVTAYATLDGSVIFPEQAIQQGASHAITITDDQVAAWPSESTHTIVIVATDQKGASASRKYTFEAVEDLLSTAVYYVLRDGVPVARVAAGYQWADYMEVGTHTYQILAVDVYDNPSYSNEVTLTIEVLHCTLATVSAPGQYLEIIGRWGGRDARTQQHGVNYSQTRYEGRRYPVAIATTQETHDSAVSLSTRNKEEYDRLKELLYAREPLIYRDAFDTRVVGVVPEIEFDMQRRKRRRGDGGELGEDSTGPMLSFIANLEFTMSATDYEERISYD